jgi:hypothetical protein
VQNPNTKPSCILVLVPELMSKGMRIIVGNFDRIPNDADGATNAVEPPY